MRGWARTEILYCCAVLNERKTKMNPVKRDVLRLLGRILLDILGLATTVFVECVWKPFHLPRFWASFLGLAIALALLYDILRAFCTIVDLLFGE